MQQFQPDSAQDTGNSDEQPLVIEELPVEASQKQTTPPRKPKWRRSFPPLIAGGILLLVAVVVGAHLLPQAPASQPSPGTSSRKAPLSTPTPTPIHNAGPGVSDQSVHPTVIDGVAYVSTSANVSYALNVSTGTLLWRSTTTKGATYLPPVVAKGIVYVNTNLSETASVIYALRATDGKLLWSQQGDSTLSLEQVVNDIVYEASGGGITAARASDGSKLWSYTAKGMDAPSVYWISVVSSGVVYGSVSPYLNSGPWGSMTTLFALRERDGSVLWREPGALLTENQSIIYSAAGNTLCAVQAGDGTKRWCRVIGPENTSLQTLEEPAVFAGILYLFTTTFNPATALQGGPGQTASISRPLALASALAPGQARIIPASLTLPQKEGKPSVYAIRIADGTILWSHLLNEGKNGWVSGFGVEHGVLYAGVNDEASPGGQVYALQSQTGKESWRTTSATPPTYGILTSGMLAISSATGSVDAQNIHDGSRLWHHALTGEIHTPPVLAGDTLYIGASTGVLDAFDIHSGAFRWQYPVP
jgi:outer membrane protein assembly factor BamB